MDSACVFSDDTIVIDLVFGQLLSRNNDLVLWRLVLKALNTSILSELPNPGFLIVTV